MATEKKATCRWNAGRKDASSVHGGLRGSGTVDAANGRTLSMLRLGKILEEDGNDCWQEVTSDNAA